MPDHATRERAGRVEALADQRPRSDERDRSPLSTFATNSATAAARAFFTNVPVSCARHAFPGVPGLALGRPSVDRHSSRYQTMKELRAANGGALRVLFTFDPRRQAILLLWLSRVRP